MIMMVLQLILCHCLAASPVEAVALVADILEERCLCFSVFFSLSVSFVYSDFSFYLVVTLQSRWFLFRQLSVVSRRKHPSHQVQANILHVEMWLTGAGTTHHIRWSYHCQFVFLSGLNLGKF